MSLVSEAWAMKDGITLPAKSSKLAKTSRRPGVWRSEDYRRLVAAVPCQFPGCGKASQAAHVNNGKGMGIKSIDSELFAACPEHHNLADGGNKASKVERQLYEFRMATKTFGWLIANGKIAMVEGA